MGIQKWFHISVKKFALKKSTSFRVTIINTKTIRIWSKWAKEFLSIMSAREPTYISQMGIQIWFHICKWIILLFKNHLHLGLTRINPKTIWILSNWAKECLNVARAWEHTYISQMGMKNLFYIFKSIIPFLPNSLRSRLDKRGPRMTRSWEKGAQELHVFARNQNHMDNSQMCIQIWFNICKWRIFLFKNHLHSGLTIIAPKTIWIWSKWEK
jgi:hypothetical protein